MNRFFGFILLGVIVFVTLGWVFTDIYIYVLISIIIAAVLRPVNHYLHHNRIIGIKLPKSVSALVSFLLLGLAIVLFSMLFVPLISKQIQVIRSIDYMSLMDQLAAPISSVEQFLIKHKLTVRSEGFINEEIRKGVVLMIQEINVSDIFNSLIKYTGNFFVGLLAVSFITFFLMVDFSLFRQKILSIIPNKYFEVSISAVTKIEHLLSRYLTGLVLQMIGIFSLASIGLSIIGVKYAITIAIFAAVANLIPYLGPLLGASFGIVVTVMQSGLAIQSFNDLLILLLKIGGVFVIVQITDNILFQPLIFSKSVKAHPMEIFVIIFAAATLAGVVGMILAIPVYTILRVSVNELYSGYKQYRIFKT
ncbi:MAG: AI-2E family transporter [Cyclobacteriaceae bacterium]|nr:AI-2E family transporter [Cyclobacteriaceae bacterium]